MKQKYNTKLCDVLDLLALFMVFFDTYGLLLPQIANYGLGMDCKTFLNCFGTSKTFTKYEPLDPLFITKIRLKIKKSLEHVRKSYFCKHHFGGKPKC